MSKNYSTQSSTSSSASKRTSAQRIVVALDASPQSLAALESAAALATLLHAEIHGIFVEDRDLERLCSLPFSKEIGAYSATARALSQFCINQEFYALEKGIRVALKQAAERAEVPWTLRVTHGGVTSELLNAAKEATVLSLGRSGWSQRTRFGSTAATVLRQMKRPVLLPALAAVAPAARRGFDEIKVIYTGSAAAQRALQLAHRLAQQNDRPLSVYTTQELPPTDQTMDAQVVKLTHTADSQLGSLQLITVLQRSQPGITILPDLDPTLTAALIDFISDPILLVA